MEKNIFFSFDSKKNKSVATKLHKQFGHPSAERLIKMIRNSGCQNRGLEKEIMYLGENCDVCKKFRKPPPKPVVSVPLAENFNEMIAIDLKSYGKGYFLVIVDVFTKYCASAVINNKKPETIIENLFSSWITIFGAPKKILSDNGGEFCNAAVLEFAESFNIKLVTTAAEAPWSNGIVERLNSVLGSSVSKILEESKCSLRVALAWAVSARNALCTYTGFSPNQLVFGYNPAFPCFAVNKLPALDQNSDDQVIARNLSAMHAARREFVKVESDKKLQKAMTSNIRETDSVLVKIGDSVYYKRNSSNEWKGPAVVVGRDGKQVLIKHGGIISRVHVCRVVNSGVKNPCDVKESKGVLEKSSEIKEEKTIISGSQDCDCNHEENEDSETSYEAEEGENEQQDSEVQAVSDDTEPDRSIDTTNKKECNKVTYKTGERVRGILAQSGQYISGKIHSRAGKSTGAYRNCFNIEKEDQSISAYDLVKDFDKIEKVSDETELLIFYSSEAVEEAKSKELRNWEENCVFSEVHNEGQEAISVRWIVTEKMKNGIPHVKARLVARGFEEESSELRKDSPTCSKASLRILMAVASSKNWQCRSLDVKSAYLQGDKISRDIYLIPPPEFNNGTLWKLHRTVYGLVDAARAWYLKVKQELVKIGFKVSEYDKGFFTYRRNEIVEGIVCVHIDDFLYCGSDYFISKVMCKVSDMFSIGSRSTGSFKYVGLNIASGKEGSIEQFDYASSLKKVPVSRARLNNKKSDLSEREKSEYRALVGQLNWLATQTRPDIAFDVCFLSGSFKNATVADLVKLNKLVDRV